MSFVEPVFVACLAASPEGCREERHLLAEPVTPMGCMIHPQPVIARWSEAHPGWVVRSWRGAVRDGSRLDA